MTPGQPFVLKATGRMYRWWTYWFLWQTALNAAAFARKERLPGAEALFLDAAEAMALRMKETPPPQEAA